MKLIALPSGHETMVDDSLYEGLCQFRWNAFPSNKRLYYVSRPRLKGEVGPPRIQMSRFLMGAQSGQFIDHVNGNTLDNRIENLRFCTQQQNSLNRGKRKNCASAYKGVSRAYGGRWHSIIYFGGSRTVLTFDTEVEAAIAYDAAAKKLHGDFARLNFPEDA